MDAQMASPPLGAQETASTPPPSALSPSITMDNPESESSVAPSLEEKEKFWRDRVKKIAKAIRIQHEIEGVDRDQVTMRRTLVSSPSMAGPPGDRMRAKLRKMEKYCHERKEAVEMQVSELATSGIPLGERALQDLEKQLTDLRNDAKDLQGSLDEIRGMLQGLDDDAHVPRSDSKPAFKPGARAIGSAGVMARAARPNKRRRLSYTGEPDLSDIASANELNKRVDAIEDGVKTFMSDISSHGDELGAELAERALNGLGRRFVETEKAICELVSEVERLMVAKDAQTHQDIPVLRDGFAREHATANELQISVLQSLASQAGLSLKIRILEQRLQALSSLPDPQQIILPAPDLPSSLRDGVHQIVQSAVAKHKASLDVRLQQHADTFYEVVRPSLGKTAATMENIEQRVGIRSNGTQ
ncbi:hypothetical protein HGRIS_003309 [Hohenbuehelia grisea]|uniref:Uncharacterized protein n=1 Tax=Hohenbuehelia grisea TaxID=104357 RepID=A0ABR3JGN6_9AGAR